MTDNPACPQDLPDNDKQEIVRESSGRFGKGHSGNVQGVNGATIKAAKADFQARCVRESPHSFRRLRAIAKDLGVAPATRANVDQYLIDRAHGRPEAAVGATQGMFQGATIIVDTGIRRARLEGPVIDETGRSGGMGIGQKSED